MIGPIKKTTVWFSCEKCEAVEMITPISPHTKAKPVRYCTANEKVIGHLRYFPTTPAWCPIRKNNAEISSKKRSGLR
jgi:hypothetical protein